MILHTQQAGCQARLCSRIKHSTAEHIAVYHNTSHHIPSLPRTVQHCPVEHNRAAQHNRTQHSTTKHSTLHYSSALLSSPEFNVHIRDASGLHRDPADGLRGHVRRGVPHAVQVAVRAHHLARREEEGGVSVLCHVRPGQIRSGECMSAQ